MEGSHHTQEIIEQLQKLPGYTFLLRVILIFILVESGLGFLFFGLSLLFRLFNADFLLEIDYNGVGGNQFILFLMLLMLLHAGLFVSGVLMFTRKLAGFYLYIITMIILALLSFFSQEEVTYLAPIAGLISIIILLTYKNRFT